MWHTLRQIHRSPGGTQFLLREKKTSSESCRFQDLNLVYSLMQQRGNWCCRSHWKDNSATCQRLLQVSVSVCVCVSQIASAILLTAQLFTKIYKKQNKISCNACWSTLVQWNATKIYFKKKTRQWPWNLQHLATPTICATKQPKLLQHKDKLHQQQHFAWWAQIQSEGLCWSSDLKIHPWVKDTVMIMMIIMIHIVFQSALIYLSSFAWCTLIPLIFGDYDVSPYIKTQYHLIWSLPVWWCLSPFLLINPRCQGTCGINPPSDEYPNKKPYLTCEAMVRFTISYPLEAVKHDVYIYIHVCMQGNGNIC